MPRRPRKPCSVPGCPELVTTGRCPAHEREAEERRGSSSERGYDTRWQRRRAAYLYHHPWCVLCGQPATVADHFPLSRKQLVARGDPDPDTDKHLRPLDRACHARETARHQPGGWNAQ
ncbi:HNH endonuclease [Streptomyces sp. SPB78]|nr:HNH endonuclease [Streptomyces sp. SPB78]